MIISPKEKTSSQAITLSRDEPAEKPEESKSGTTTTEKQKVPIKEFTPKGIFSVQVASVSTAERAQILTKELVDRNYDAYYYSATVNGKKTYRIMCGKFTKRSDAVMCLNKLKINTGYKGFIVKVDK